MLNSKKTKIKNILLIDPDKEFCKNVQLYLQGSYHLAHCTNLQEIKPEILRQHIDLLLIDADHFGKHLASFVRTIRQSYPYLKVIVMYTFFEADKKEELVIANEADALIAKPFDVRLLEKQIDDLFRMRAVPVNT